MLRKLFYGVYKIVRICWILLICLIFFGFSKILSAVMILILVGAEVCIRGYENKCPTCKKWFALKKLNTEEVDSEEISILTQLKTRDNSGRETGTQEQYIPGKRITYKTNYLCKKCGAHAYNTYTRDKKRI